MKLFKKNCKKCYKLFRPTGKSQKICEKCIKKIREGAVKKQRNYWEEKRNGK